MTSPLNASQLALLAKLKANKAGSTVADNSANLLPIISSNALVPSTEKVPVDEKPTTLHPSSPVVRTISLSTANSGQGSAVSIPSITDSSGVDSNLQEYLDSPVSGTKSPANSGAIIGANATEAEAFLLKEKIAQLSTLILEAHPLLPVLLQTIHKQLRLDPELVSLLDEEEIGVIVNGLKKQTQTEIVAAVVKSAGTARAKKTKVTLDML